MAIAWDAQGDFEMANAKGERVAIATYDYYKYFDSFDHDFASQVMMKYGMPKQVVSLVYTMWTRSHRTVRQASALGEPFHAFNGLGQGDLMSLIPAFCLCLGTLLYSIEKCRRSAKGHI